VRLTHGSVWSGGWAVRPIDGGAVQRALDVENERRSPKSSVGKMVVKLLDDRGQYRTIRVYVRV
jgi:hypothetical protein